jgi:hypothetical protein
MKRIIGTYIFIMFICSYTFGQNEIPTNNLNWADGIKLTFIGQSKIKTKKEKKNKSKKKEKSDVYEITPDDTLLRFCLKNESKTIIYYLATIFDEKPTGFLLYKNDKNNWLSASPAWRKKVSLTSDGLYRWLPLNPMQSVETEFTALSQIETDHGIVIFINKSKKHDERIELISEPVKLKK